MEASEADWREGKAGEMYLSRPTGPLAGFARRQDEDGTVWWERRQVVAPGKLGGPTADRERLTPEELLQALRGPLGAP